MYKYVLEYSETYSSEYEVDAETPEEAKEVFLDKIYCGDVDGPRNCTDSFVRVISKKEEIIDVIVCNNMQKKIVQLPVSSSPIEAFTKAGVVIKSQSLITINVQPVKKLEDLFKTFAELGIHENVYLVSRIKADNA